MPRDDSRDPSRGRGPSPTNGKDDGNFEEKLRRLEDDIKHFCDKHHLNDKVERILSTIHGKDAEDVITTPFPEDCRNPNGFVVSTIRKLEKERARPQGYRWDKTSWEEPPRAASRERATGPGKGGRRDDSRPPPRRRGDSRGRGRGGPPPRRRDDSRR
eukprot:CAMPEP_0169246130 /NCGR_PEP_ID=MMETSP1016-20121227/34568_1 /TAXON_ID=342587 /ORGANISM="Karlodinium micrum, Strain CCMP2283" /LENGTH=157 /DNA_ID=CAMNT_0009326685 /DNA_START=44 /DNA_END=513 /DNA_ORIENTATION=+